MSLKTVLNVSVCALVGLVLVGCGKPESGGGGPPPGDWPANAVVAQVLEEQVDDSATLVASLSARDDITLVAEVDAAIVEIAFEEGQAVEKDAILMRLDDTQTAAQVKEAEARFGLAKLTFERNADLLKKSTISQAEMDQSEAEFHSAQAAQARARDAHSKTTIRAPFKGTAGEHMADVGQFVSRGTVLTELIGTEALEVVCDVPERYAPRLAKDQLLVFESSAYAGETFEGRATYVAPRIDARSRTIRVKGAIENADGRLKPGMFGQVALVLERREKGLTIPEACVQFQGDMTMVVTLGEDGRSAFAPVTLGLRMPGRVEVVEGLSAGDYVIVEGFQKMGPGMMVIASEESATHGVTPGPIGAAVEAMPPAASPEAEAPEAADTEAEASEVSAETEV